MEFDAVECSFPSYRGATMPAENVMNVSEPTELKTSESLPLQHDKIAQALQAIAHDSRVEPQRYLQETTVPHGGE